MKAPGVIVNGRAGRARRDPRLLARIRELVPGELLFVTHDEKEVEPALESLASAGVDTLAVVGGDGTVTGTLTPLFRVYGGRSLPSLLLLAGGTINTIASSLGAAGSPAQDLAQYLRTDELLASERPLLEIRTDLQEREDLAYGLIFANGGCTRFLDLYYASRERGAGHAAATLARILGSAAINGSVSRNLMPPFEAQVVIDGDVLQESVFTAMAAAGVEHIGLGFRPFFSAASRPDRVHFISTRANARQLGLEIPWTGLGWRRPASRLSHASPKRVEIVTSAPMAYTIDGDLFAPTCRVVLSASPPVRFVRPA